MFGPHVRHNGVSFVSTIKESINEAKQTGFEIRSAALFVGGPRTRRINLSLDEQSNLKKYIKQTDLKVIAHSAYAAYPWRNDPLVMKYIDKELETCENSGITGLVIHLPKLPISSVMSCIPSLPTRSSVRIYFETPAIPGVSFYDTPQKLAELFTNLKKFDPDGKFFGLCFDTAHLWTCGVDIRSFTNAQSWIQKLESYSKIIPPETIMCHLNDSLKPIGVGPDVHAQLTVGEIWKDIDLVQSGLFAFIQYIRRHNMIAILERSSADAYPFDYNILRHI